ncbi:MAG: catalase [Rhodocyclaceae bacterium]|nr:catalase [Rhodocyclaceae bacterium]
MQKKIMSRIALAGLFSLAAPLAIFGAPLAQAAEPEVSAPQVVAAIEGAFGVTPGERRNHTKGTCAVGEFVGSKAAAAYSRSALFSGDPEDDPTLAWPEGRKEIKVGTLSITSVMSQKGAACEPINYDPLVMAAGIAPTKDPVLQFRSPAYAVSFAKRLSNQ